MLNNDLVFVPQWFREKVVSDNIKLLFEERVENVIKFSENYEELKKDSEKFIAFREDIKSKLKNTYSEEEISNFKLINNKGN